MSTANIGNTENVYNLFVCIILILTVLSEHAFPAIPGYLGFCIYYSNCIFSFASMLHRAEGMKHLICCINC